MRIVITAANKRELKKQEPKKKKKGTKENQRKVEHAEMKRQHENDMRCKKNLQEKKTA